MQIQSNAKFTGYAAEAMDDAGLDFYTATIYGHEWPIDGDAKIFYHLNRLNMEHA